MKKLSVSVMAAALAISASGCSNNNESQSSIQPVFTVTTAPKEELVFSSDNILNWAVPDIFSISISAANDFNRALTDSGCDYNVNFITLSFENYTDELINFKGELDIAFSGFNTSVYKGEYTVYDLAKSGFFCPIDDYLTDSKLYDVYSQKQWQAVSVDAKNYFIPNITATESDINYIFNNEYFSQEEIESFSLKFEDVGEFIGEPTVKEHYSDIIYTVDGFQFSHLYNNTSVYSMVYSEATASILSAYFDENCISFFRALNEYYNNGYINYELNLSNNSSVTDEYRDMLSSGSFKLVISADEPSRINTSADITVRSLPTFMYSKASAVTGIISDSTKKDLSFDLLEKIHTTPELLKYLILDDPKNNQTALAMNELIIGSDYFSNGIENMKSYYDNEIMSSEFLGFNPDYTDIKDKAAQINAISIDGLSLWKAENFTEELENIQKKLAEAGISEVTEKLNVQFAEYNNMK